MCARALFSVASFFSQFFLTFYALIFGFYDEWMLNANFVRVDALRGVGFGDESRKFVNEAADSGDVAPLW